jgi:PAS domain S-box-containing protein
MSFEHDTEGAYDDKSREQLILELKELRGRLGQDNENGDIKVKETRENALKWVEAIFENSLPIPIQAFDLDGVVTHWNSASAQLYGFSAKEAVGRRLQDLILSGESASVFEECIKQVVSAGRPTPNRQWEINCRNGEKRWVYSTIFPIFEGGQVTEIFCMNLDITERIEAEKELRKVQGELELRVRERTEELNRINKSLWKEIKDRNEAELALSRSESFLKNIFDCIKDGITIMDTDMNIIGVNNTMESWYPSMLPLVGKKCYFAYFGHDKPCENCPSVQAIEKMSMQTSIRHSITEDGADRWRDISSFPFKDSRGEVVGAITIVRDITARKRIEEALEFERSQLLSIFDSIDDAIYVSDPVTYEMLYANRAMKELFGKELIGGVCYREIQGRDAPCEFCTNALILKDRDRPHVWEFYNPMVNRYAILTDRIIKWPDGRDVRFEIATDITDRKKMEDALLQSKSDAELYVDLMGHDINNMNQVGIGYLELAMDVLTRGGKLDLSQHSLLSKSLESFNNSSKLIDNVRKIQRERRGDYEAIVIDVNDVLLDAIGQCSSATEKNVTINYAPSPGCSVKANELIKDVFLNLIGNAIKHSGGPVTIRIKLEKVNHNGLDHYKVSVEDDGPGIPDSLKSTLFDRLNLASTHARGKGFGLCLIKMLVDDYAGMFWAEDRVPGDYGKGAKFVVMLPAVPRQ